MKRLEGKVAIVTGGARDIGRAVSLKLASEGAKVVINYFDNLEDAKQTRAMIAEFGGESIIVQGDMTKAEDVKRIVDESVKAYGNDVHVLVNVVGGIVGRKKITEQDEAWYNFLMDVNMKSCWLCTREVVPHMPRGGAIVNFSSLAARDGGGPGASMYATAKGAVAVFTRAMAKELGPDGIRVNAVAPGMINTEMIMQMEDSMREGLKERLVARRMGEPSEIANTVYFLGSE